MTDAIEQALTTPAPPPADPTPPPEDRGDFLAPPPADPTPPPADPAPADPAPADPAPADPPPADPEDVPGPAIPKARFDQAVHKERSAREEAEARAAQLEAELERLTPQQPDQAQVRFNEIEVLLDQIDSKLVEAQLDGDTAAIKELTKQSRALTREQARIEVSAVSAQQTAQVLAQRDFDSAVDYIENASPIFKPGAPEYNQGVVDFALFQQQNFIRQGYSPARALIAGAQAALNVLAQPAAAQAAPPPAPGLAQGKADDRKAAQVAKNLETLKQQAPNLGNIGANSDSAGASKGDASKMSDEEFDALPAATKKALRGDSV